jgi:hypothetical protein
MRIFLLTVAGDPEQKCYIREDHIMAIFPSKDGGCLLYLTDQVQIAVEEPVWEYWVKKAPAAGPKKIGDLSAIKGEPLKKG